MDRLFAIGDHKTRPEIQVTVGTRLHHCDRAAVYRFDRSDWCLILDEDNGWWINHRSLTQVTMGVNPGKRPLNFQIRTAWSQGQRTFMFYRRKGEVPGVFEFLGEVRCTGKQGDYLLFEVASRGLEQTAKQATRSASSPSSRSASSPSTC